MKKISQEYLDLQKKLYQDKNYGTASIKQALLVKQIFEKNNFTLISDYGAGKKNLQKALFSLGLKDFKYFPFDPAFPEYGDPKPGDLVCCIDVMEHIEPEYLDNVINDLKRITINTGFLLLAHDRQEKFLKMVEMPI